tara:strand:+ start:3496 stop:3708 length:213 start_codon:yes stop_codon:yes gene_type:complete
MKTPASFWAAPRLSHIILSLVATAGFLMADAASRIDVINAAEVENAVLQRTMAHVTPAQPLLRQASLIRR